MTRRLTQNDRCVYYERRGTGPRLLFLNGSGGTIAGTMPLLGPFAEHTDLLIHDQRGLGRTEVPPGPYTMAEYAEDARAMLDAVGWTTARVLGLSFGGMVAQELAVTVPERVERVALLCTSPGGGGGSSYPLHELVDVEPEERARRRRQLVDTRFDDAWLESHPRDRAFLEAMGRGDEEHDPERLRGLREQLAARRGHDVWDRLGAITCPTLVACGRYDGIAPPSTSAAIASQIAGCRAPHVRWRTRVHRGGSRCCPSRHRVHHPALMIGDPTGARQWRDQAGRWDHPAHVGPQPRAPR